MVELKDPGGTKRELDDEPMPNTGGVDDLEVLKNPLQRPQRTPAPLTTIILYNDDVEIDQSHESNDNFKEVDGIYKVVEMKPLILTSNVVVKVEKDYWTKNV